jgi:PAS domain S-box-containing protein
MLRNLKIGTKIFIAFLFVTLVSISVGGYIAFTTGRAALEEESFNKLTAVREMKVNQIEGYFEQIANQVITLSQDRMIIDSMRAFDDGIHNLEVELDITNTSVELIDAKLNDYYENEYLERLIPNLLQEVPVSNYWPDGSESRVLQDLYITSNPNDTGSKHLLNSASDGSSYSQVHEIYHPILRDYLDRFGYYDIFLVDVGSGGHIAYSVFKEVDFGTSLLTGPYSDTNFAEAYRAARDADDPNFVRLVDFEPYHPSYNAPAAFIASPIFDGDEKIGVLVFQMPIDRINNIMTNNNGWSDVGLGESGETYIVGDDFLLRNQSRFLIEDSVNYFRIIDEIGTPLQTIARIRNLGTTIGLQSVQTQGTEAALRGETATQTFPDYRGVSVLSSYRPLNIDGVNWVIMSEIDEAEAFAPVRTLRDKIVIGAGGLLVIIVAISALFSRTITKPIHDLTEHAAMLAGGHLSQQITVSSNDEIGELADSFDIMRQGIKRLIDDLETANETLEQRVVERTAELAQANERINTMVETASDAIITINSDQNIVFFNPKAEIIFGYLADEVIDQPLTLLMPEQSHDIHTKEVNNFRDESVKSRDMNDRPTILAQRKDGSLFPSEAGISKMVLDGEVFFTAFFRDITKRKEMEARLQASELKHRTIFENSPLGLILFDNEGFIVDCNERFVKLMRSSREQLIGFHTLKAASDPAVREGLAEALDGKQAEFEGEYTSATGGATRQLRIIYNPINTSQLPTGVIATLEDITERRKMEAQLQEAFQTIKAQKDRMERELNFARDIQMGMLPLIFPAFPDRPEVVIYANLKSAREVGGDFYDFYFLNEESLCFVIGDVSGKGAPGALLMAVTKTLLKSRAQDDLSTASILTHVNNELAQNNESMMFVTIFMGIMNVKTGELIYSNAGHNPPYIKRDDDTLERLDTLHGPVVGPIPGMTYKEDRLHLTDDDMIMLYTDGITEAMNEEEALFTEKRLVSLLMAHKYETAEDMLNTIIIDVEQFQGEAEQADDITGMALHFHGNLEKIATIDLIITIKNRLSDMDIVEAQFEAFTEQYDISDAIRQRVSIVLDELLNNTISYAYPDTNEHEIVVKFELSGERLVITISDDGIPFNPFGMETPDVSSTLEERKIGGLGIHVVRKIMDEFFYQRRINKNVVTLVKFINK